MVAGAAAAFYCVADARYFLGAVAMINSLRIQGHDEPIHLLDLGLEPGQRELLGREAILHDGPRDAAPWLSKTIAPRAAPAEVMILIDTDLVATRHLGELVERIRTGGVLAFENPSDRFCPEWGEALGLGELHRGPYACAGLMAFGGEAGAEVLDLLHDLQRRVDRERIYFAANEAGYPFLYPEQDVLNAILASHRHRGLATVLESRLGGPTPFRGLEVLDERTLRCAYGDGLEPWVVHQLLPPKPWEAPIYDGVYSRLLRRLLCGPDLALRVQPEVVPLRLRPGRLAYALRRLVDLREQLRWRLGGSRERLRPAR